MLLAILARMSRFKLVSLKINTQLKSYIDGSVEMNKIKQFTILFVGIFIGYVIAGFTLNNIIEDINLYQAKPSSEIKPLEFLDDVPVKNS